MARQAIASTLGVVGIVGLGALAAGGCNPFPCGSVSPSSWQGTITYTFTGASDVDAAEGQDAAGSDAGSSSKSAPIVGSLSTTVELDAFAPWVTGGEQQQYCGASTFSVDLGPSCELTATVTMSSYGLNTSSASASAVIDSGQTCTLDTPSGSFTVAVRGGNVAVSGKGSVNVLLNVANANIEFLGNLE
jgi:hypothetical protein